MFYCFIHRNVQHLKILGYIAGIKLLFIWILKKISVTFWYWTNVMWIYFVPSNATFGYIVRLTKTIGFIKKRWNLSYFKMKTFIKTSQKWWFGNYLQCILFQSLQIFNVLSYHLINPYKFNTILAVQDISGIITKFS